MTAIHKHSLLHTMEMVQTEDGTPSQPSVSWTGDSQLFYTLHRLLILVNTG